MRRRTAMLVIAVVGLVGSAVPAAAVPTTASDRRPSPGLQVAGDFHGTSTWEFDAVNCEFVHQVFTGTYTVGPRGNPGGTYDLDVCVNFGSVDGFVVTGTFIVTVGHHVTLTGTVSGLTRTTGTNVLGLELTLTVTGSSGTHRPIRGTITADGTTDQSVGVGITVEAGEFTSLLRTRP
jgi:hypothetical protein